MKPLPRDTWALPGRPRRVPVMLQSEAAECGLACVAMIAAWHGHHADMATMRRRHSLSLKGTTLKHVIEVAGGLGLTSRPVRLELEELSELQLPCILHWDLNHFVVLTIVARHALVIIDPARGERRLTWQETRRHFTGVAVELEPAATFQKSAPKTSLSLSSLMRGTRGLNSRLAGVLALALSLEAVALASPFLMQWVVDGAVVSGDRDLLLLLALGFVLLVFAQAAIGLARSWVVLATSNELTLQWNRSFFAHLLQLPIAWFERRHLGDVVSRFGSLATVNRTLTTSFIESLIDGLMAGATLCLMFFYSTSLAAVAVVAALLYVAVRWAAFGSLRATTEEQLALAAKANSMFIESVRAVAAIKLFNHEEARQSRWMNATVEASNRNVAAERLAAAHRGAQTLISGVENVLIVYLGAIAVIEGGFSVGMLFAFVAYRALFATRVTALVDKSIQLRMLGLHKDRLADIVLEPREDADRAAASPRAPRDLSLEARGIWFRYGDGEPWVLQDVNIAIRPGECVAITGPSGGGKTTLLKLLTGLLTPSKGEIRLGGVALSSMGLREYRRRIGAVLQDDHLLAGSIADNIAFLDPQSDRSRVEACARIADVHDEVVAMSMGYETLVGDMGSSLSGGQKQRILLARALYKRPQLLFLDEATSHLDVRKESRINESIRTLRVTRVLIAHRPETIASAQRVIVLENGQVTKDVAVSAAFTGSFPRPRSGT